MEAPPSVPRGVWTRPAPSPTSPLPTEPAGPSSDIPLAVPDLPEPISLAPPADLPSQSVPSVPSSSAGPTPRASVDPIASNADCRSRRFADEVYYDFRAFMMGEATRDSTTICRRYFLEPFMVPRPFFYPRVVMDFYQTMTTREVRQPEVIYFTIDGVEGTLTAESIARALRIPLRPLGDAPAAPHTDTTPQEMVRILAGGPSAYPTCILRRELPPHLLLVDHVLRSNLFPCQHIVQRRGEILDALFRISQGQWFSPAHLIMTALIYFEEKVHCKKLQRAAKYELFFPRLLSLILERHGFPAQPRLERKRHCREILTLEQWLTTHSVSRTTSLTASTEHHYTPPASVEQDYALDPDAPESPVHHAAPVSHTAQTPPPLVPPAATLHSPPPTAASVMPPATAPIPDPSAASSSQVPPPPTDLQHLASRIDAIQATQTQMMQLIFTLLAQQQPGSVPAPAPVLPPAPAADPPVPPRSDDPAPPAP